MNERLFVTQELVDVAYKRLVDGYYNSTEIITAAQLEAIGGPCPECGVPFQKVTVNDKYGDFHYFKPACRCYRICKTVYFPDGYWVRGCGRYMIAEKFLHINHCTACGNHTESAKPVRTQSGYRTARRLTGQDAAAGDKG